MKQHQELNALQEKLLDVKREIDKAIIGQEELKRAGLICLVSGAHALLESPPGLAKTYFVRSLAKALGISFQRIQCTPDLMPKDIVGVRMFNVKTQEFQVQKGPIDASLVLVDEINRASPKTQSAFLEAMQEREVTIGRETFPLPNPFMVFATQNPIEHEGTYPLPEAQLDRFMMKILLDYPTKEEELLIVNQQALGHKESITPVMDGDDLVRLQSLIVEDETSIQITEDLKELIVKIVQSTRNLVDIIGEERANLVQLGASPRASIFLTEAARANAFIDGRRNVEPSDIVKVAPHILRHRILVNRRVDVEEIIQDIIKKVIGYGA